METTENKGPCVYVLELLGDPVCAGSGIIIEIGGVSLDRSTLEKLKVQKDADLSEYFDGTCVDPECPGWDDQEPAEYMGEEEDPDAEIHDSEPAEGGCEKEHNHDEDWCYHNSDYSSCPAWYITSYPLL